MKVEGHGVAVHAKLTAPIRPCAVFSKMKLEEVNARTKEAVDFLVAALETGHKWGAHRSALLPPGLSSGENMV